MATYKRMTDVKSLKELLSAETLKNIVGDIMGNSANMEHAKKDMAEFAKLIKNRKCPELYEQDKMRSNPDITSAGKKYFNKLVADINEEWKGSETPVLLKIIPLGLVAQCHDNSKTFVKNLDPAVWEWRSGYNLTNCPCGQHQLAELHSVVYHIPTETYYDLTKDFDGLTEKMFLPIRLMDKDKKFFLYMVRQRFAEYIVLGLDHKCTRGIRTYGGKHDDDLMSERREEIADLVDSFSSS